MQSLDMLSIPSKIAIALLVLLIFLLGPGAGGELGSKALALIFLLCVWNWDRIPK